MSHDKLVLIVEDDPEDAAAIEMGFADHCTVGDLALARSGDEAVNMVLGTSGGEEPPLHPAVILLDLTMPKVSGLDVVRRLKGDPRSAAIPIVVLTASANDHDVDDAYECGANSYVVKPVSRAEFVQRVGRIATFWLEHNERPPG